MRDVEATTTVPEGNRWGFVSLYERTVTDVYSYLASRVGDWAAAEDLTQDVFVAGARHVAAAMSWIWPG